MLKPENSRVLSVDEMTDVINDGCTADLFTLVERVEQAVLAKLAEQTPFTYHRTLNGEPEPSENCICDCPDMLLDGYEDIDEDGMVTFNGYGVMPLYAHPIPVIEQEPVAYIYDDEVFGVDSGAINEYLRKEGQPLYAHPTPSRQAVNQRLKGE